MKKESKKAPKEEPFESALKQLEGIVQRMESGDLPLEESLLLFEEGVRLTRVCSQRLDEAEKRIDVLMRDEQGRVMAETEDPGTFQQETGNAEEES